MPTPRAVPTTLLAVIVLFAGCVGGERPRDGSDSTPGGRADSSVDGEAGGADNATEANSTAQSDSPILPWNMTAEDCTLLVASIPIPTDEAAKHVPEGFETAPFAGAAPDTAGAALVVTKCARAATPDATFKDHQEALIYVYVNPPSSYRVEGIDNYRVLVRHGASSLELGKLFAAQNVTTDRVSTTAVVQATGDNVETMDATATFSNLSFSFRGPVAFVGPGAGGLFRIFTVAGRTVSGAFDLELAPFEVYTAASNYDVSSGMLFGTQRGAAQLLHYDMGDGWAYRITVASLK